MDAETKFKRKPNGMAEDLGAVIGFSNTVLVCGIWGGKTLYVPEKAGSGHRLALVFGPERTGLSNDDVYRCHSCLSIPTAPDYGSLNLAMAVQLLAYEWRQALGGFGVVPRTAPERFADAAAVQGLLGHWERTLVAIGFLDPAAPRKLVPRLNRLANRLELTEEEVHILRGIARAVQAQRK